MAATEQQPLAVIGSIHGNEALGAETVGELDQRPRPNVVQIVGHPDALAAGERCFGPREIGGLVPGDPDSADPDISAAGVVNNWLIEKNPWCAFSIHENRGTTPGSEYVSAGRRTRKSTLAVAHLAGHRAAQVELDYPLYVHHPQVVESEHIITSRTRRQRRVREMLRIIDTMAELGPEGMAKLYRPHELGFYIRGGSFMLIDYDGQPNELVVKHLETLERVTAGKKRFDPLELPEDVAKDFGLSGLKLYISSGNHRNMSQLHPSGEVSVADGTARRVVLGGFFVRANAPKPTGDDDWLEFEDPHLDLEHFQ